MAAEGGHEGTVKYLVEEGADIHAKDKKGVKQLCMVISLHGDTLGS